MSSNNEWIDDADDEYTDWIELYNGSSEAIELKNYYLGDNSNEPLKWKFPEIAIASDEYLRDKR